MRRIWLRMLLSLFLSAAVITVTGISAYAFYQSHQCPNATIDAHAKASHCHHAPITPTPVNCDSLFCGAVQISPTIHFEVSTEAFMSRASRPQNDDAHIGAVAKLSLRPPIY